MAGKLYNLARMTTATTGTGTITLGAAVSGCLTFALAGVANGETVSYGIRDGANSEVGTGVYTTAGTTLTRTPTTSTNANAAINLSGTAEVFITPRKEDLISVSEVNTFTATEQKQARENIGASIGIPDAIIEDQKASGTSGGTSVAGLNTRALNTLVRNNNTVVQNLAGSQFQLGTGSYYISWSAPVWRGDQHLAMLRNVTDGFFQGIGTPEYAPSATDSTQSRSIGSAFVTIATSKVFSIQHQIATARATNGLGLSVGFGVVEVYTRVEITKLS